MMIMNDALFTVFSSETDRRALIIVAIIILILLLLIALIGALIRWIFNKQSEVAEHMMYDVVVTNVVIDAKHFKRLAIAKSNRLLFKQTIFPFLFGVLAVLSWVISAGIRNDWAPNVFVEFGELFFQWDFEAEGVWTKVFGITLLANWPPLKEGYPSFVVEHIGSYLASILAIVSIVWFFISCQGYLARFIMIQTRARTVYGKSLDGIKSGVLDPEAFKNKKLFEQNPNSNNDIEKKN